MSRDRPEIEAPRLARWMASRLAPPDVLGDLQEQFLARCRSEGPRRARSWYRRQVLAWVLHRRAFRSIDRAGPSRDAGLRSLALDLGRAFRDLWRAPLFSVGTIFLLAVGLGAATTVFSMANWVLLRPVPGVATPERLVTVRTSLAGGEGVFPMSHSLVRQLDARLESVGSVAAYGGQDLHLSPPDGSEPTLVAAQVVTGNFFDVLGLAMSRGRGFTREEGADPGAASVIVLSERFWRSRLGAREGVVGSDLLVNGHRFTVVGVAAPGFRGPERPGDIDAWVPVAAHRAVLAQSDRDALTDPRATPYWAAVGRLADGATLTASRKEIEAAYRFLIETVRGGLPARLEMAPRVEGGIGPMPSLQAALERTATVMLAIVGFLLVVTCANFANLLLARGLRRGNSLAVQAALGATGTRLLRQQIAGSTTLALVGGAVGMGVAHGMSGLLRSIRLVGWATPLGEVALDARVALFATATALLTGGVFGALPAIGLTRRRADLAAAGRDTGGGSRLRTAFVAVQLGVCFGLLVAGASAGNAVRELLQVDLGYDPRGSIGFTVRPGLQGYGDDELDSFYRELLAEVRAIPGVTAAGLSWLPPYGSLRNQAMAGLPGDDLEEDGVRARHNAVSGDFFAAAGVPMIRGREFDPADSDVVILNESLAERLFPHRDPVGQEVKLGRRDDRRYRVVGVVGDARLWEPDEPPGPALFEPPGQPWALQFATVQLRSPLPPEDLVTGARAALGRVDPNVPLHDVATITQRMERRLAQPILIARLGGGFALLALVLAGAGLYGVLAARVAESRREMGIRAALGASAGRLRSMVLLRALQATLLGLLLGIPLGVALAHLQASTLRGAPPFDPWAWGVACLGALVVAFLAGLGPARRAGRLAPMEVLSRE